MSRVLALTFLAFVAFLAVVSGDSDAAIRGGREHQAAP